LYSAQVKQNMELDPSFRTTIVRESLLQRGHRPWRQLTKHHQHLLQWIFADKRRQLAALNPRLDRISKTRAVGKWAGGVSNVKKIIVPLT
jgi:hypothetical protein